MLCRRVDQSERAFADKELVSDADIWLILVVGGGRDEAPCGESRGRRLDKVDERAEASPYL